MSKQILTLLDIEQLQKELHISPPASPYFDCGTFQQEALHIQTPMSAYRSMFYQIALYTKGLIHLQVNEQSYTLPANTLFMCSPGTVLSYTIQEPLSGYYLLFSPGYLAPGLLKSTGVQNFVFFHYGQHLVCSLEEDQVTTLTGLYQKIYQEKRQTDRYTFDMITCYITLLILQARRMSESQQAFNPEAETNTLLIRKFQELITQKLQSLAQGKSQRLKSVSELAKELHIHPNYLNEVVQKELGKSASSFIQEKVVLEALTLLRQTDLTVKDVAFQLGFQSAAHFSAFFKKKTTYSPLAYKQLFNL